MRVTAACLIVVVDLLSSNAMAQQQHRGSFSDQMACTPDVYRLCSEFLPDEDDIVACLQRKKTQLSAGCGEVFSRPDTPAPKPADPGDQN